MTDADELAFFARQRWGMSGTPEEIGRLLVARHAAGPRLWAGMRILRSLGVLVGQDDAGRPS